MSLPSAIRHMIWQVCILFCMCSNAYAQLDIEWDNVYGAEDWDELTTILPLSDGYIAGGRVRGSITAVPFDTAYDCYLVRTDLKGNQLWAKPYGGRLSDEIRSLVHSKDGSFIFTGTAKSDTSAQKTDTCRGQGDVWVVKVDIDGNIIWDKTFGGSGDEIAWSMMELANGDLIIAATSDSPVSGEKSQPTRGGLDLWLLRLDQNGNLLWETTIGGARKDYMYDMVASEPEQFIYMVGGTESLPGEGEIGTDPRFGKIDLWMVKYDIKNRGMHWSHRFGAGPTGKESYAYQIIKSYDGNFIIGGTSDADGSPPAANADRKKTSDNIENFDYWVFKVDKHGDKVFGYDISLGTTGRDQVYGLYENFFGDLLIAGVVDSLPPDDNLKHLGPSVQYQAYDLWVYCMDRNWNFMWEETYGGDNWDTMTDIIGSEDGSFVIGGHSASNASFTKSDACMGKNDMWIIKTNCAFFDPIQTPTIIDPCTEQTLTLTAGADTCGTCVYFWSTGDSGPHLEVPPGFKDSVRLLIARRDGCLSRDTTFMDNPFPPEIELGPRDSSFLVGEEITIGGNNPELQYLWSSGDTTATITVNYSGVFAVTVTDAYGCTATDWIKVYQGEKEHVYIPNVFSPDFDGKNDYFNIYCDASVKKIVSFQIFDRWGNGLWVRTDYPPNYETDGWDGTFRGTRMLPASYRYHITIEFLDGVRETFDGTISIVRGHKDE